MELGKILEAGLAAIPFVIVVTLLVTWARRSEKKNADRDHARSNKRAKAEIERQRKEEQTTEQRVAESLKRMKDKG